MNRYQLEKIYQAQNIDDYNLKNLDDLRSVHGVVLPDIKGYQDLTMEQQKLFSKFIIHFYNAFGLDIRATLMPKSVYWAEDANLIINDEVVGQIITSITATGRRRQTHRYKFITDNVVNHAIHKSTPRYYLRFELKSCGCNEWYHVISEKQWY